MTTATENDLTTLRERQRQLADRLADLRSEQTGILDDVSAAEQDFLDSIETGDDSHLLGERVDLRKRELSNNRKASDHIAALLAVVDREIGDVTAKAQLRDAESAYLAARTEYSESLDDLPDALPTAIAAVGAALDCLLGEVADARDTHDRLAGTAGSLRQRSEQLGIDVFAPAPESWTAPLERAHGKESATWQLMLAVVQRRGAHAVLAEIERVITLDLDAKRRALR